MQVCRYSLFNSASNCCPVNNAELSPMALGAPMTPDAPTQFVDNEYNIAYYGARPGTAAVVVTADG